MEKSRLSESGYNGTSPPASNQTIVHAINHEPVLGNTESKHTSQAEHSRAPCLTAKDQKFVYGTLNRDSHVIRRLHLQRGHFDDPLYGALDMVSLDASPDYEALSYVWGTELSPAPIYVDGAALRITCNLETALRHLRYPDKSRKLWVDAISIDQDNLEEKSHQVQYMGQVFRQASLVLVWLGTEANGSGVALQSIRDGDTEYQQTYEYDCQLLGLLLRPWFTRIWVVQELILASHAKFGCGLLWVDCQLFLKAWETFNNNYYKSNTPKLRLVSYERQKTLLLRSFEPDWISTVPVVTAIVTAQTPMKILAYLQAWLSNDLLKILGYGSLVQLSEDVHANPRLWMTRYNNLCYDRLTMLDAASSISIRSYHFLVKYGRADIHERRSPLALRTALALSAHLKSTDPRDKVYAILGLVCEDDRRAIPVEYGKPVECIFLDAALQLNKSSSSRRLDVSWPNGPISPSVPSWVPDFTSNPLSQLQRNHFAHYNRCCRLLKLHGDRADPFMSSGSSTLSVSGVPFGHVSDIVPVGSVSREDDLKYLLRQIDTIAPKACSLSEILHQMLAFKDAGSTLYSFMRAYLSNSEPELLRNDTCASYELYKEDFPPFCRKAKRMAYFTTDLGHSGFATSGIAEGDVIVQLSGMSRSVALHPSRPASSETSIELKRDASGGIFYRNVGIAFVGCHDPDDSEGLHDSRDPEEDWREHACFKGKAVVRFDIV